MKLPDFLNKRLQSIILVLVIAIVATGGFLLLMSWMAAPAAPPEVEHGQVEPQPAQQPNSSEVTASDSSGSDEVVATVNDEVITKQAWQQATRLDAVMSRLVFQPIPTAEETLDRLVNEIVVLEGASETPAPTAEEVETRILTLTTAWNVTAESIESALVAANLNRVDLTERVGRLIQVETALNQLAAQEDDVDAWLIRSRASAEISLYHALVDTPTMSNEQLAINNEQSPTPAQNPTPSPFANSEQTLNETEESEIQNPKSKIQNPPAPPPDMPTAPYAQNAAPDFTLPQLGGGSLTLSDFRGKPTIINFWATWCPPCRRELPALQAVYSARSDEIGFIAVDVKEGVGMVEAFVKELGLTFPIALDEDGSISNIAYEVRGLPTTIFVDANGVVAARHIGPLDEALIDSYLAPLLPPPVASVEQPPAAAEEEDDDDSSMSGDEQSATHPMADLPTAPDFTLVSADGNSVSLQDYRDKSNVVLVFYRGYT